MATPLSADRLVAALRAEGLTVVEHRSWRTHNRNSMGPWGPMHGVMIHHTVTKGTASSVALCYTGHSTLPGPLCHGVIAKDGSVYLISSGRANHAGSGDDDVLRAVIDEQALPADNEANTDGNRHFYGFEAINLGDGEDPWPAAQLEAIERASAAICRAHGWSSRSVIGHLEWQPGKIDPRGFTMDSMRTRIADRLDAAPTKPAPTPPIEEDDMPTPAEYAKAVWDHGISNRFRPGPDGKPRIIPARYYAEWSDSHHDDVMTAVRQGPAVELTPEQLAVLAETVADKLADHPMLAEQIADVIAKRMAE